MKHITRRTVVALIAAAAVITLATGCSPTEQEELDGAQMRIDCDRLGGEFIEYWESNGAYDPRCRFDDLSNLRLAEER